MPDLHVAKITAPTATGNQSYTGFGFQPKAILAFATAQSVEGVQGGAEVGFGMASGASAAQRSAAIAMEDNQTTTKTDRRWDDSLIHTISAGAGAIIIRALVVSFDADGVTLNWTHTLADRIVYLVALGGAEISNAELVLFTAPTAVGTQDVVNAGGFQPDVSVLLTSSLTALGTAAGAKLSLGAAQTTAKRWALAQNARDAQTMAIGVDAIKEQRTDLCLVGLTDAGQDFTADLSTVLSNGIRLNWVDAPASAILCAALMLKGSGAGMFDVGSFAQATGTAPYTQDVATSPNFEPAGVLLASFLAAAAAGLVADAEAMIGAAKNAAIIVESAVWENCEDFTLPTMAAKESLSTKVITNRDSTGVGGQTLLVDQADLDAFLSTGFRLNWGTATTSILEQFLYLAVKKTSAGVTVAPATASAVAAVLAPIVVLGSLTVSPAAASLVVAKVDPAVVLGSVTVAPASASAVAAVLGPAVVLGSMAVAPAAASAVAAKADPAVVLGSITFAPAARSAIAAVLDPAVILGSVTVSPAARFAIAAVLNPTVILGSTSAAPAPATALAVVLGPAVAVGEAPSAAAEANPAHFAQAARRLARLAARSGFTQARHRTHRP